MIRKKRCRLSGKIMLKRKGPVRSAKMETRA
jgi:hypothetical protein